jgi:hypothetical protein
LVFRPDDFRHAIPRAPAKAKGGQKRLHP